MLARLSILTLFLGLSLAPSSAHANSQNEGLKALKDLRDGLPTKNVVQNRFIVKENRFEMAPVGGYVPNNPMVKRYVGGLLLGYHLSETFAAEGAIMYSPDLGQTDLKDLTHTLVQIANTGSQGLEFQQPLDKMIMGATFAARWAPVYGKINLVGEKVLNFDLYAVAGVGMLSISEYYATYDGGSEPPTSLEASGKKVKVPINLGLGIDFFLSSSVALKLDGRSYLYPDKKPQYDPNTPTEESRLYNNFVVSIGPAFYFPKMKPRLYNF